MKFHGCDYNPYDHKFANANNMDINLVSAARQMYMKENNLTKDNSFNSLEDFNVLPGYIEECVAKDRYYFTKVILGGDTKVNSQNVIKALSRHYNAREIELLSEGFRDMYYYIFNDLLSKGEDGRYLDEDIENLANSYREENLGVEPSIEYLFRQLNFAEINGKMQEGFYSLLDTADLSDEASDLIRRILRDKLAFGLMLWKTKDVMYQDCGIKIGKSSRLVIESNEIDGQNNTSIVLEETVREGHFREKDKEDPLKDIHTTVNLYLSRLKQQERYFDEDTGKVEYRDKANFFGMAARVPVSSMTTNLLSILSGCTTETQMRHVLEYYSEQDPIISTIYTDLNNSSSDSNDLANAFYRSFCTKTKANMRNIIERDGDKGRMRFFDRFTNRGSFSSYVFNRSNTASKSESSIFNNFVDGKNFMNAENWRKFSDFVTEFFDTQESKIVITEDLMRSPEELFEHTRGILKIALDYLDIPMNSRELTALITNAPALQMVIANLCTLVTGNRASTGSHINNSLLASSFLKGKSNANNIKGILRGIEEAKSSNVRMVRIDKSNFATYVINSKITKDVKSILYFKNLAQIAMVSEDRSRVNIKLREIRENLRSYIYENYFKDSKEFKTIDANGDEVILHDWLDKLYNTKIEDFSDRNSFINNFDINRIMGTKINGGQVMADDMSENQALYTLLQNYLISLKGNNTESSMFCAIPMFTSGDTGTIRSITTTYYKTINSAVNGLIKIAISEMNRMELQARAREQYSKDKTGIDLNMDGILNGANTSSKAEDAFTGKFTMLTFLNDYIDDLRDAWNSKELNIDDEGNTSTPFNRVCKAILLGEKTSFKMKVGDDIITEDKDYTKICEEYGTNGGALFKSYMSEFYKEVVDKMHSFGREDLRKSMNLDYDEDIDLNESNNPLLMFYLNSMLGYCNQFMFTHYNPAFAGSTPLKQSVNLQKRNKANYTPGISCNVEAKDIDGNFYARVIDGIIQPERVLYFNEHTRNLQTERPELYEAYEKIIGKDAAAPYRKGTNSTDGQGFRVLTSYRRVMGMTGNWNRAQEAGYRKLQLVRRNSWERAAQKLNEEAGEEKYTADSYEARMAAKFTAKEIDELNELNLILQPIKPHTSSVERLKVGEDKLNSQVLFVPIEHKLAEVVLIPEIFGEGSKYKELAVNMELNDIDAAMSTECVKVGNFGSFNVFGESAAPISESISKAFELGMIHNVDYADYTIQIEVPPHLNVQQLVGTQMRKHMIDGILSSKSSYYLRDNFNSKIGSFYIGDVEYNLNGKDGRDNALKLYNGLVCAGFIDCAEELGSAIDSPADISDILTTLKSNDRDAGFYAASQYALNEDKSAFINPLRDPLTLYDTETLLCSLFKKRILKQHILGGSAVQISDAGFGYDLETHMVDGNPVYSDCVIPWEFHYTDSKGNKVYLKYSEYVDDDGELIREGNTTKLEKEFPGILDMVAYRIPTERDYSIINLKAKKFVPKVMGGVVSVPWWFITTAGWDFDIDKLYYFQREYKEDKSNRRSRLENNKIWNEIYGIKIIPPTKKGGKSRVDDSNASGIYRRLIKFRDQRIADLNKKIKDEVEKSNNTDNGDGSVVHSTSTTSNSSSVMEDALRQIAQGNEEMANLVNEAEKLKKWKESESEVEPENENESSADALLNQDDSSVLTDNENEEKETLYDYLYQYWEDAGLDQLEITGFRTAREYFDNYANRYRKGRWEKVGNDGIIDPYSLSKTVRNNLLFDFIQSRLTDPATGVSRLVPGGFADFSEAAKVFKELEFGTERSYQEAKSNPRDDLDKIYSPVNPLTTAVYHARNLIAKDIIAIMANHSANMVFSQALNKMELKVPISVFGYNYADMLGRTPIKGKLNTAMKSIAGLLASSVDAVKDPVLNFLNINKTTASTAALMGRLGMTPVQIGLILRQPIIMEVCKHMSDWGGSNIHNAIIKIGNKHTENSFDIAAKVSKNYSEEELYEAIRNKGTNEKVQLDILRLFDQLCSTASSLEDFMKRTKFTAANSIDNTFGSMLSHTINTDLANESKVVEVFNISYYEGESKGMTDALIPNLKITDVGYEEKLTETPLAIEQAMHDLLKYYIDKVSKYLPYRTKLYSKLYELAKKNHYRPDINSDLINAINYGYPLYLLQNMGTEDGSINLLDPDSENPFSSLEISNRAYYTKQFVKELGDVLGIRSNLLPQYSAALEELNTCSEERYEEVLEKVNSIGDELEKAYDELTEKYSWFNISYDLWAPEDGAAVNLLDSIEIVVEENKDDLGSEYDTELKAELANNIYSIRIKDNLQFDKDAQRILSADWEGLLSNNDYGNAQNLGVNLLLYNIHKNGFNASINGFGMLATPKLRAMCPIIIKEDGPSINYNDIMNNIIPGDDRSFDSYLEKLPEFLDLLYRNNAENGKIVNQEYISNKDLLENKIHEGWPSYNYNDRKRTITFRLNSSSNKSSDNCNGILVNTKERKEKRLIPAFSTIDGGSLRLFVLNSNIDPIYRIGTSKEVVYEEVPIRNGGDYSRVNNEEDQLVPARDKTIVPIEQYSLESMRLNAEVSRERHNQYMKEARKAKDEQNVC